jgi:hypothetical protein
MGVAVGLGLGLSDVQPTELEADAPRFAVDDTDEGDAPPQPDTVPARRHASTRRNLIINPCGPDGRRLDRWISGAHRRGWRLSLRCKLEEPPASREGGSAWDRI